MDAPRFARLLGLLLSALALSAPAAPQESVTKTYSKRSVMVPMRDGTKLYTEIYEPFEDGPPLPIVFLRTPYRVADAGDGFTRYMRSTFRVLAEQRYIFAVQDARGRHNSEGTFEWNRPVRHRDDADAVDASTDAWDSIEWLTKKVANNNGRVGMLGVSYPGWYVAMALVDPHPALRAASPQASPSDYFIGDDFFHFGAFRLSPSVELPYLFDFDAKANARFPYDQVDTYEFFLDLGPIANINKRYLKDASPTWNHFMAHSTYDDYWVKGGTLQHYGAVTVPTLNVVGWWDAENLGGALDLYERFEQRDPDEKSKIVVGPWYHGQWAQVGQTRFGPYEFGSDLSEHYQRKIEAPWFAHHLKGEADPKLAEATMFQTGSNRWERFDHWPPETGKLEKLYFHPDGSLSFEAPTTQTGAASFVSDPSKPVPYSKRPIMGFWSGLAGSREPRFARAGRLWKVEDQRFVEGRPDVLVWQTEPLEEDVQVTGALRAELFASTTGTDADWVVKIIDVYPEDHGLRREMGGYQLMIADDVLRGKFRGSFAKPEPLESGAVTPFTIDLRTRNHRFRKGHRIMVQVQSTWFPLIDRNPQIFVDIPKATAEDFRKAEHTIHTSMEHPSHLVLQIATR